MLLHQETKVSCPSVVRMEILTLHLAFAGRGGVGPQPLAGVEQLSKSLLSCKASHVLVCWLKRARFSLGFFYSEATDLSEWLASLVPSLRSMRQKR